MAILSVLLFHAGITTFSGGFVGVDIFFVISGYLITGIIARDIDAGRFSIMSFYERRARRIMPVLVAVIIAVLVGAAFFYLPVDFETVPRSAIAAILFLSNLWFFHDTGYFQGGAETKPLLHTWSLAIEEQFYIGFPILLALIARYAPRRRRSIIAAIALASFTLAVATQDGKSGFAFYLLPPRAWELFAGALLALGAVPAIASRPIREGAAAIGLAGIAFAVLHLDRHSTFPGANALWPVLGAVALIHCAPGTSTGRLLASPPLVGLGLISYSLYMWHWPLIVFFEYVTDTRFGGWSSLGIAITALLLAGLSWRFIEAPFRHRARISQRAIFLATGSAIGLTCLLSGALLTTGGWPGRFAPQVLRMAAGARDVSPDRARCHDSAAQGQPPCTLGAAVRPTAVLWGDSHGVELAFVLSEHFAQAGRSLIQQTRSSCPPLLDYDPPDSRDCARTNRAVLAMIRADPALRTIYLAGFWASYRSTTPSFPILLDRTIATLVRDGRRVVLIGPIPSNAYDVPRHLAHLAQFGALAGAPGGRRSDVAPTEAEVARVASRWRSAGLDYVSAVDRLCGHDRCAIVAKDAPLYFDTHHLSVAGARLVLAPPLRGQPAM